MAYSKRNERRYPKVERKHGEILGIKVSITSKEEVLKFVNEKFYSKEKFYIVTPNPENILIATKDWLLEKTIRKADLSIPDGIGLAQAYKFLNLENYKGNFFRPFLLFGQGIKVGLATFLNKKYLTDALSIIKGRELFIDILKTADQRKLKIYLFGGERGESEKAKYVLQEQFKNTIFKTQLHFPKYNKNCQPVSESDRKMHKAVLGSIKLFEPDFIFVAMNTPKQEKWIFRNFFRLKAIGAMAVGGTYNYISGNMRLPPVWLENLGLEWVYRFLQEPGRLKRILNAVIVFPWTVFKWKLNPPKGNISLVAKFK